MDFFGPYRQQDIKIRQYAGKSPMFFRRLSMMGAYVLADLNVVKSWLPKGLAAASVSGGKAVLAVHCFEYQDVDIGPYNEVSVAVAVQSSGLWLPSFLGLGLSKVLNKYHGFVKLLPVTTEVAVFGGLDFFNYPKKLADIQFRETAEHRICTVRELGDLGLSMEWEMKMTPKNRRPTKMTFYSYPEIQGKIHRGKMLVDVGAWSENVPGKGTFDWRFGKDDAGELLKAAELGTVVSSFYAPDCRAILFEPVKL